MEASSSEDLGAPQRHRRFPARSWLWVASLLCALDPVRGAKTYRPVIMRFTVPKTGVLALSPDSFSMLEQAVNHTRNLLSLASPTQRAAIYYADDRSDAAVCEAFYLEWAMSDTGENATDVLLGPVASSFTESAIRIANSTGKPIILWAPDTAWQHTGFADLPSAWVNDQPVQNAKNGAYDKAYYTVDASVVKNLQVATTTSTTVPPDHRCESNSSGQCGVLNGYYVDCDRGRACCNSGWCHSVNNVTEDCFYGKQQMFSDEEFGLACAGGGRRLQELMEEADEIDREAREVYDFFETAGSDFWTDARNDLEGDSHAARSAERRDAYQEVRERVLGLQENARFAMELMFEKRCDRLATRTSILTRAWVEDSICGTPDNGTHYTYAFDIRVPMDWSMNGAIHSVMERNPSPQAFFFGVERGHPDWLKTCTGGLRSVYGLEQRFNVTVSKMMDFYTSEMMLEWAHWLPTVAPAVVALCGSDRFIVDLVLMMQGEGFAPDALIIVTPLPIHISYLVGGYNSLYFLRPAPWPAPEEFLQFDCLIESNCNESLVINYHFNAIGEWVQALVRRNQYMIPSTWEEFKNTACCDGCGATKTHLGMVKLDCSDGNRPHYRSDPSSTLTGLNIIVPLQFLHSDSREGDAIQYGSLQNYMMAKTYLLMNQTLHRDHDYRFEFMPYHPLTYPMAPWARKQSEVYPCPIGCHLHRIYDEDLGHALCSSCPPGKARGIYDHECKPCHNYTSETFLAPTYADSYGFASCLDVPKGGRLIALSEEPVAEAGYYRFESWVYEKPVETQECIGDGNPHEGFTFMRCLYEDFCLGNNTCIGHNDGVMCLYCKVGYTNMFGFRQTGTQADKECEKCPGFARVLVVFVYLVILYTAVILMVSYFSEKDAKRTIALRGPIVRMLLLHMQVLGSINDTDESYTQQSTFIFDTLLYRPFDLLALDCFYKDGTHVTNELAFVAGYWKLSFGVYWLGILLIAFLNSFSLVYKLIEPPARLWGIMGAITYFCGRFDRSRRTSKLDDGRLRRLGLRKYSVDEHAHYALEHGPGYIYTRRTIMIGLSTARLVIFRHCVVWTIIMYPIVLRGMLKMSLCSMAFGPLLRLRANLNVKCAVNALSGPWQVAYASMATGWAIIVPLVTWMFTFSARGTSQQKVETQLSIGLLMQGYTTACPYWQVIMYVRIAVLLLTNSFLHVEDRLMGKLFFIMLSCLINELWQPFDHSHRFVMRKLDRMMHISAMLSLSYSSSEARRHFDDHRISDGEHAFFDISWTLRMLVMASLCWLFVQASWSILILTYNPNRYSTEAKSQDSKLRCWHHAYLWLVQKVRGKSVVIVGWGPSGKYVDTEHLRASAHTAFNVSLQKTLTVCLNSRELFPPAFLQVAFYEAFRRAIAGSDASVDAWRIKRHHRGGFCNPRQAIPFYDSFKDKAETRAVGMMPSVVDRSPAMAMPPSILDRLATFRFKLDYRADFQRDFHEQAERLKQLVGIHFPDRNPETILSHLSIRDRTGQDVQSSMSVAEERFPLSVHWVAERHIHLDEIEAAVADVAIDIEEFHPDCHRLFADDETGEAPLRSPRRKQERADAAKSTSLHAARDGDDSLRSPESGLSGQEEAERLQEETYRTAVEILSDTIGDRMEMRVEAAELSDLRKEMRRLQGIMRDLNVSLGAQHVRSNGSSVPVLVLSDPRLRQDQAGAISARSVASSARPDSTKKSAGGLTSRSTGITGSDGCDSEDSVVSARFDVPPPVELRSAATVTSASSASLLTARDDEGIALGRSKPPAEVTSASSVSLLIAPDNEGIAPGRTKPPAEARAVPNGSVQSMEPPAVTAPKGSGAGAAAGGLQAAAPAAEAARRQKAMEFWAAHSCATAYDATPAEPAQAVALATAVDAGGSQAERRPASAARAPEGIADEDADGLSEFTDWSMPADRSDDEEEEEVNAEGGQCSQQ